MTTTCIDTLGCRYDQMVRFEELEGHWPGIIEWIESMATCSLTLLAPLART